MNGNKDTASLITVLVVGFIGGLLASLLIFGLNKFPDDILANGHPLISAPFLAFLGVIIVIILFHAPIQTLLSKGQLTIKWGDKEISIAEIEQNIDEQFNQFEAKLSDLSAEIQQIKSQYGIESEDLPVSLGTGVDHVADTSINRIKTAFEWVRSDELAVIVYYLGTSKYKWRNQSTLIQRSGLNADRIDELIRSVPECIIRSRGKSGNIIYRLSDQARGHFLQLFAEIQ
ncbi:MAG: hypothetical protein KDE53_40205 [Caldilineaceae bacterium]|nr:hypothetical protein [Caldilineaceae bacterium]